MHSIYVGVLTTVGFCLFAASISLSTVNLTVNLFLASVALILSVVIYYDVTFKLFKGEAGYYAQLGGFLFGVGTMCGPFLVALFKLATFKVIALC